MNNPTKTQPHSQPQTLDTLEDQLTNFREDPTNGESYAELRSRFIATKADGQLAELAELHAPHIRDPLRAAKVWAEAGLSHIRMNDQAGAERALRNALGLDPRHEAANKLLVDFFIEHRRYAEAAATLEAELRALTEGAQKVPSRGHTVPFAARRAERHCLLAHLWDRELGRVDQALAHWQQAWQLDPENAESLQAARVIYTSLGDQDMVIKLYESELAVLADSSDKNKRARIEHELGRLLLKSGRTADAAGHLEIALRLKPDLEDASVALAEAYSSPANSKDPESPRRAGKLFVELGRRRFESGDSSESIRFLRRALGVDPYSFSGFQLLEKVLATSSRWDELDRLYLHRSDVAESDQEREMLLKKRALLYDKHLLDRSGLKSSLEELATQKGSRKEASLRLRELYRNDGDWAKLTTLIESDIEALDPHNQIEELLELASIYREHRRDRDRAAELLHQVLSIDPHNEEALNRYAEHFRERRDWRGLADLLEFSIENAQEHGAPRSEIIRRLEELAKLAELRLGDVERSVATWQRIDELEPRNPRVREAIRRLLSRAKMWESLVSVLEKEAEEAQTPQARVHALARIAQVYRERQVNPRQAIALYEEVLQTTPNDEGVLKALTELYEREGDDAGHAATIRRQLDLEIQKISAQLGGQPLAKDWPVAKRVERLTALRRLASMYEEKLADVEGVVFACGGVLEILPGDRDALERMERVLEKVGDIERLEQTLEYHAAAATGPAEKAKVLKRLARLDGERDDDITTLNRWEQVLAATPNDQEALEALAKLYEHHERWTELAAVLERNLLHHRAPPERGSPEAAHRAFELKRYALVVHNQLKDSTRATRAWKAVLEISSNDRDALAALAELHQSAGQWRELASVLETLAPLYQADEPERATEVALRRAQLLEERLGAPAEAAAALETLISELSPRNLPAHQALRRIYESRAQFDAAVRIAEREMYLTTDSEERIIRGMSIGGLCRDRLNEPARALQAYERVLAIEPNHRGALIAAADLYAKLERWPEHVAALEKQIETLESGSGRRELLLRIGNATGNKLNEPKRAFEWYRAAHEYAADATTISELRRSAETFELWDELAEVYDNERTKRISSQGVVTDINGYIAASRELAAIAERRLADTKRAMETLRDAIVVQPNGEDLFAEAERLARAVDTRDHWEILSDCLKVRLEVTDKPDRVAIHCELSKLAEQQLGNPESASTELLRAFACDPDREATRTAVYELAERTGSWADAVAIEAARFERAASTDERVAILHQKASVIEDKLTDQVRAFRTHLSAFLLAPENQETLGELWRLAKEIGSYDPLDRMPRPEPAPAHVDPDEPSGRAPLSRPARSNTPRVDATQELNIGDLFEVTTERKTEKEKGKGTQRPPRNDQTMPIDLDEIEELSQPDPTMQLRTQDLIEVLGARTHSSASLTPTPPTPPTPRPRLGGPPPPPSSPKLQAATPGMPRPLRQRQAKPANRPAPTLPVHTYDSPWAEFAAAYDQLPARTSETRLRWLFRSAELWESGAQDIPRAFETLARAMDVAPDKSEPRDRLHRLAKDHGEWDRLAELYEIASESAGSADRAVLLLLDVAEVRTEQERTGDAESIYRRILGMRPEHEAAREQIESLYREQARWVDLAASLEERTDPRLGVAAPEAQRPALLRELAALYADKLSRRHDAIDALERLRKLSHNDVDVLNQLADLFGQIGRWSKVVEMLKKICDVADETPQAQLALHRIGQIYELELELPDRAVDTYVRLVSEWSDDHEAFEALDRLYQQQGKWVEHAQVLDRRASLAREPAERIELLRRRSTVLLNRLGAAEEAATSLRHARTLAPQDPLIADMLVEALTQSDAEREAASILEARIEAREQTEMTNGDLAALLTRLAVLRSDYLRDPEGAKSAIEEALVLVPNHPSALATLARLAEARHDPKAFAEAKLREASFQKDVDSKVDALLAAAKALCEIGEIDAARAALEEILAVRMYHPEATWTLAALVEQTGDLETASRLLETRLEDKEQTPSERAQVLTQLAALARQAGVESIAERRLAEALNIVPNHFPAILGTADLLCGAQRYEDLVEFLLDVGPVLEESSPEHRAEVFRRLALAQEALGNEDNAYQTLLGADRLDRNNLLIKLAMGENRYRARRWREAALHLSALGSHLHAERYPSEVAEGLYHAALAEIRSLRPEKAEALYTRAAELKPNYAPALQALAEVALERGDDQRAADLLTRQATATQEPLERMRLFEALGDMAIATLNDQERALVCYEAAVSAAVPLESHHIPLLQKLLDRQTDVNDHLGAARTAELLSSFASEDSHRAQTLKMAAQGYLAGGQREQAKAAAGRALEAAPHDLTAAAIASELSMADAEYTETIGILSRALSGVTVTDEVTAARQSMLWYRLGCAQLEQENLNEAEAALETAISIAPEADGSMMARRKLLNLWVNDPDRDDQLIEFLRRLAADTMNPDDVSAYARALITRGSDDGARVALELAASLGRDLINEEVAFLGTHPVRRMAEDESYRGSVSIEDRQALLTDSDDHPLSEVFASLWEAAPLLWNDADVALADARAGAAERIGATSETPAAAVFTRISRALRAPATVLFSDQRPGADDARIIFVSPPVIILGPNVLGSGDEQPSELELRFLLARAAELSRPERIFTTAMDEQQLSELISSLNRLFAKDSDAPATASDDQLRKMLPVKVRQRLRDLLSSGITEKQISSYRETCERVADRAGLLICGDLDTARRSAIDRGVKSTRYLERLVLATEFLDIRFKLGVGIKRHRTQF